MPDRKEHILAKIRQVANLLNKDSLTSQEFLQNSNVSESAVRYNFGSWNRAVESAGLKPISSQFEGVQRELIPDRELLDEIVRLTNELGKSPSESEMNALGRFSTTPYRKRWGTFSKAKTLAYSESVGHPAESTKPPVDHHGKRSKARLAPMAQAGQVVPKTARNRVRFGAPIGFRGVRHAPINEQGVVYLFGMVSRELGFLIESVRTG